MSSYKHAKVITRTPRADGTVLIETESYFESLEAIEQEIRQSIKTTRETLLADVIKCLAAITSKETPELNLVIVTNPRTGEPDRIVKTWIIKKERLGRRQ